MRTHAPCGMCQAYVPADTGCQHWKPIDALGRAVVDRRYRESRRSKQAKRAALVEEFAGMLKRGAAT